MWRRYRWIAIMSVPVAALIGALLALTLYVGADPEYREQGGWSAFLSLAATGAVLGALSSLPAVLGAAAALAISDRSPARTPQARMWIGGLGAAAGALVCWTAMAVIAALAGPDGESWLPLSFAFVAGASLISGFAAAALIRWAEALAGSSEPPSETAHL